ncbi:clarin-3 [Lampris incognitus]|uniref:clarin-3 n=1 Tax=Lampris incognitus TaxID=2546036 RepID=UPI0024B50D00|nr:clarin-3 [Lampris incognitus]
MPSSKKILHYTSSALATSISVGLLGYALSTEWAETTMRCTPSGNGTAAIKLALFVGNSERFFCPYYGGSRDFPVFAQLQKLGGVPVVLHGVVLCLVVLCLLFSAGSILVSLYNSVSNPYETYMGPIGVYTCNSLSACLAFVVLICFVANVHLTNMAEELVQTFIGEDPVDLTEKVTEMKIGYYLLIPYITLTLLAIALIFIYDHAAYTHKKEQQRPTEDAPKEIMMY